MVAALIGCREVQDSRYESIGRVEPAAALGPISSYYALSYSDLVFDPDDYLSQSSQNPRRQENKRKCCRQGRDRYRRVDDSVDRLEIQSA